MIINWNSAKYDGHTYLTGRDGAIWNIALALVATSIDVFDGLMTSMNMTGVGH